MKAFKFLSNIQKNQPILWMDIVVPDDIIGPTSRVVYKQAFEAAMNGLPITANPNLRDEYCYTWNRGWLGYHIDQPINNDTI